MKIEDNQLAAIGRTKASWLDACCPYSMVANSQEWEKIAKQIQRKEVITASPETRSMMLAAAIAHESKTGEICRMILVANENEGVDNFEYYSSVLWLLHAQTAAPKIRAKIIMALGIAPIEHVRRLHQAEDEAITNLLSKVDRLGLKEASEFSNACYGIIKYGAKESLLKKIEQAEAETAQAITEAIGCFNFFISRETEEKDLVLV